ncbi:MAG: BolA family protein [Pseudobdellovibrionaceae bacterium]
MSSRQFRLENILKVGLEPTFLEVVNESHMHAVPENSETHFKILVVSAKFMGLSRIDRQRLVNELVKAELKTGLHALTQRALTPDEWEEQKAETPFESPACQGKRK